ncbi:zinc finger with KRAB and SCAN domains 3-like protein [Labeo rohita]|uniref:Zinc finger with KRAB and SCAN domains 3-like protein n=1 Tax=Labeo rohita TaxID=84645 RepID=A0A498MGA2_LABRO|nr:zinc finger with KRAB and SCAN domains 3-like protein [Labeo rohita]
MKKATVEDLAWISPETTEEEEVMAGLPDTSKKSRSPRTEPVTPVATAGEGMISLMRQFLDAQQQREERYLQELRGLRETILQSTRHAETLSVGESPRMELPTPAAQRVSTQRRSAHGSDSPSVPVPREPMQRTEPKMPIFQQGEDIENYLRRFERLARTWRWPEEEWSYRLVPLLTGQALEAYLAMDEEQAEVYEDLKEALLEKFNISPETYRQRFRSPTVPAGESPTETYHRLKNLYQRWVRPREHSKEEIGEAIILEQLLRVLPYDARTWVREHEPTSGLAAAKLAQQYLNAHRGGLRTQPSKGTVRTHVGAERGRAELSEHAQSPKSTGGKDLICFYCQQPGHKAAVCPVRKAKLTGYCYVPREGDLELGSVWESLTTCDVTVNGHSLQALLDTGCSMSMLKSCYVTNVDYLNTASVQCVHGDVKRYPRAEVLVEVQDQMYLLNVAIVDSLPTDMILGQDLPVLNDLLQATAKDSANVATAKDSANVATTTETPVNLSFPAITRSQARAGLQPLPDFDDSLLQGGTKGPRKSRRQKRLEKYLALMVRKVTDVEEEDGSEVAERHASVVSLTHLEDIKRQELQHLLDQFPALFRQRPGRTELIQHTIHLTNTTPSRQRPYRVPERLVEPLRKEVEMMKELGVIEPSMKGSFVPQMQQCKSVGELISLKASLGDWIAECGVTWIYNAGHSEMPRVYSLVIKHFIYLRPASMILQFKAGMNSCGSIWQTVEDNWMAFKPLFTNTQKTLSRKKETSLTFEDLLTFMTGADAVPPLGFPKKTEIDFYTQEDDAGDELMHQLAQWCFSFQEGHLMNQSYKTC